MLCSRDSSELVLSSKRLVASRCEPQETAAGGDPLPPTEEEQMPWRGALPARPAVRAPGTRLCEGGLLGPSRSHIAVTFALYNAGCSSDFSSILMERALQWVVTEWLFLGTASYFCECVNWAASVWVSGESFPGKPPLRVLGWEEVAVLSCLWNKADAWGNQ